MLKAIKQNKGNEFDAIYRDIYGGSIWRSRWSLWYFTCVMKAGDIVIIPRDGDFSVCKLLDQVRESPLRDGGYRSSAGSRNAEIVEGGTSGRLGGTEKIFEDRVRFCIIGGRISPTAFCISEVLNEVVKGTSD